jgi:hypothetical protein
MADTISQSLASKTPAEITQAKADLLAKVPLTQFDLRGYSVIIKELTTEKNMLKVWVEATKDGKPIFVDNPLYYLNPPYKVPDGTFTTAQVRDRSGKTTERQVANFKEDPEEALKEIIVQTLEVTT